jgi:hypothetical protein
MLELRPTKEAFSAHAQRRLGGLPPRSALLSAHLAA